MRLAAETRSFETNMDTAPQAFQIKASAKAFQILSSSIYKHKPLAIVRELLANAVDAHVDAGTQDTPIEVHLPTGLESWLTIKDFGTGLSEEGIYNLYTTMFGSNKTHTNELIGGFGLGSKSPFAYTDQFTVDSRHNGREMKFQAYVDTNGMPMVAKISDELTTEHPGLTVTVPVNSSDIPQFDKAAETILVHVHTVKYKINKPIDIKPIKYSATYDLGDGVVFKTRETPSAGNHYARHEPAVIMGIVPYELDISTLGNGHYDDPIRNVARALYGTPFDIVAPIGTFDIAASRETLSYDDHTKKLLTQLIMKIGKQFVAEYIDKIDAAPDLLTAVQLYDRNHTVKMLIQSLPYSTESTKVEKWLKEPTWQGKNLSRVELPSGITGLSTITGVHRNGKGVSRRHMSEKYLTSSSFTSMFNYTEFYWMDKSRPFSRFFADQDGQYGVQLPAVLVIGSKEAAEKLMKMGNLDPADLGEVPIIKPKRSTTVVGGKRQSFGAHEYQTFDVTKYASATGYYDRQTITYPKFKAADIGAEVLKGEKDYVLVRDFTECRHNLQGMQRNHMLPKETVVVRVPAAHKKVRKALIDAGAYEDFAKYCEANDKKFNLTDAATREALSNMNLRKGVRTLLNEETEGAYKWSAAKLMPVFNDLDDETWWVMARLEWLANLVEFRGDTNDVPYDIRRSDTFKKAVVQEHTRISRFARNLSVDIEQVYDRWTGVLSDDLDDLFNLHGWGAQDLPPLIRKLVACTNYISSNCN